MNKNSLKLTFISFMVDGNHTIIIIMMEIIICEKRKMTSFSMMALHVDLNKADKCVDNECQQKDRQISLKFSNLCIFFKFVYLVSCVFSLKIYKERKMTYMCTTDTVFHTF